MKLLRSAPAVGRPRRRGAVLLLVLTCLLLAAVALVSIARQSHRLALDATAARTRLQHRWGSQTVHRAILPLAAAVFEHRDQQLRTVPRPHPPAALPGRIRLGNIDFSLLLADEDARANINTLYHFGGLEKCRAAVRVLTGQQAVRLQPEVPSLGGLALIRDDDPAPVPPAFHAWGQVFELTQVSRLQQATRQLSLLGSEAINIRRAEDAAVREVVATVLPQARARRLVERYRENRVNEIEPIIRQMASDPFARKQLSRLLSESSVCYSLWVISAEGATVRQSVAVSVPQPDGVIRTAEFEIRGP